MSDRDAADELREIQSLRQQGTITPQEAYERHMALLGGSAPSITPAPYVARPIEPPPPSAETSGLRLELIAIALALVGGVLGILGAGLDEIRSGGGILLAFTGAPIIEEAMKPAGIYLLLLRWPQALRGRLHTATLCAMSGIVFGLIESVIYVTLYHPDLGAGYVAFRFTVPVTMHAIGSFIVGYGIDRGIIDWAAGRARLPKHTRNFYIAAVVLHATYNLVAVILELTNVINFD